MDKRWITLDKNSDEYREGVKKFVLNSKRHAMNPELIICPCAICRNLSPQTDDDLEIHLMRYGVDPDYDIWCAHGEEAGPSVEAVDGESSDQVYVDYELPEVHQMYKDAHFHFFYGAGSSRTVSTEEDYRKKVEAEVPLYPGCKKKHTKLLATLIFYKFKADNGLADSSFDELLEVIRETLPKVNTFPESLHRIKKILEKI
ncbi:hypothetical protein ACLB2K_037977 [Fragaria x ananassa]